MMDADRERYLRAIDNANAISECRAQAWPRLPPIVLPEPRPGAIYKSPTEEEAAAMWCAEQEGIARMVERANAWKYLPVDEDEGDEWTVEL